MGCSLHTSPSRGFKSFLYPKHFACIVFFINNLDSFNTFQFFQQEQTNTLCQKWVLTADLTSHHVCSHSLCCGLKAHWLRNVSLLFKALPVCCTTAHRRPLQVKRGTAASLHLYSQNSKLKLKLQTKGRHY